MGGSSRAPKALDTALEYGQAIKRLLNFVQKVFFNEITLSLACEMCALPRDQVEFRFERGS